LVGDKKVGICLEYKLGAHLRGNFWRRVEASKGTEGIGSRREGKDRMVC